MHDYGRLCRPAVAERLNALALDVVFEEAEGDLLRYQRGGETVEVVDFAGGYGATLLGHNHPELVKEALRLLNRRVPMLTQASFRNGATQLAARLCDLFGDYMVTFTNSGTEAIEAALKHATMATGKGHFLAVRGGFHGKTLGAIQLTEQYREPFEHMGPSAAFVDADDPSTWAAAEEKADTIAAIVLEPVLGEGGVVPLPPDFVAWVSGFAKRHKIPLIADEIQTGLGRCGAPLASSLVGLEPDYVCLAKALGGGLAKTGALLVRRDLFVPEFSLVHTSTFAEDDFSSFIAHRVLQIVEEEDIARACREKGDALRARLEALREEFPGQVKEVRGLGLMIGLEFQDLEASGSNMWKLLSAQGFLGALASSYLLNVHRIRVLPTLSQPFTIRIQPSAYISEEHCDRLVEGLRQFLAALRANDVAHVTGFQIGLPTDPVVERGALRPLRLEKPQTPHRVAFIGHVLVPEHIHLWEPSMEAFEPDEAEELLARTSRLMGPTIFERRHVRSSTGRVVHVSFVGLNLTARQMSAAMRAGDAGWIMEKIEAAVALARDEGCRVLGLGGFTSIVCANGLKVKTPGVALTTGNALTVGTGVRALTTAAEDAGIDMERASLAVVGAAGNTASVCALTLADQVERLVLIARDASNPRIERVRRSIVERAPEVEIVISDDMNAVRECSLVITASNAPDTILFPEHLNNGPVVICDIAEPGDVDPSVSLARPDARVFGGGQVRLPHNPDFRIAGIPLDPGCIFACMAETLLMGLEERTTHGSYGRLSVDQVWQTLAWADKHGFSLAPLPAWPSPAGTV